MLNMKSKWTKPISLLAIVVALSTMGGDAAKIVLGVIYNILAPTGAN